MAVFRISTLLGDGWCEVKPRFSVRNINLTFHNYHPDGSPRFEDITEHSRSQWRSSVGADVGRYLSISATRRHSTAQTFFADADHAPHQKKVPKPGYTHIGMWEMLSHFSMEKRIIP